MINGIWIDYNEIIYKKQHDYENSLEYFKNSLLLEEGLENKQGIANSDMNIGYICRAKQIPGGAKILSEQFENIQRA